MMIGHKFGPPPKDPDAPKDSNPPKDSDPSKDSFPVESSHRYVVGMSHDWTSARGNTKRLRLCALGKTVDVTGESRSTAAFQKTVVIQPGGAQDTLVPQVKRTQMVAEQRSMIDGGMLGQQMANRQQNPGRDMSNIGAPSGSMDDNFGSIGGIDFEMGGPDVLDNFDFDSFLTTDNGTNGSTIDTSGTNFGYDSQNEAAKAPLHRIRDSSSGKRRTRLRGRQISSQLTTHESQLDQQINAQITAPTPPLRRTTIDFNLYPGLAPDLQDVQLPPQLKAKLQGMPPDQQHQILQRISDSKNSRAFSSSR
ncbi:hypothetical protein KCU95_g3421, partial [Aureobasidium melanogenum]